MCAQMLTIHCANHPFRATRLGSLCPSTLRPHSACKQARGGVACSTDDLKKGARDVAKKDIDEMMNACVSGKAKKEKKKCRTDNMEDLKENDEIFIEMILDEESKSKIHLKRRRERLKKEQHRKPSYMCSRGSLTK